MPLHLDLPTECMSLWRKKGPLWGQKIYSFLGISSPTVVQKKNEAQLWFMQSFMFRGEGGTIVKGEIHRLNEEIDQLKCRGPWVALRILDHSIPNQVQLFCGRGQQHPFFCFCFLFFFFDWPRVTTWRLRINQPLALLLCHSGPWKVTLAAMISTTKDTIPINTVLHLIVMVV